MKNVPGGVDREKLAAFTFHRLLSFMARCCSTIYISECRVVNRNELLAIDIHAPGKEGKATGRRRIAMECKKTTTTTT